MGCEVDFHPVGNGERSGDAICLRIGNISGSREQQLVMVIKCGFHKSGEEIVNI